MKTTFAEAMNTMARGFEQAEKERHEAEWRRREGERRRREAEREQKEGRICTAVERHADVRQFRSAIDSEMKELQAEFQQGHDLFMHRHTSTNTATHKAARKQVHHGRKSHAGKA